MYSYLKHLHFKGKTRGKVLRVAGIQDQVGIKRAGHDWADMGESPSVMGVNPLEQEATYLTGWGGCWGGSSTDRSSTAKDCASASPWWIAPGYGGMENGQGCFMATVCWALDRLVRSVTVVEKEPSTDGSMNKTNDWKQENPQWGENCENNYNIKSTKTLKTKDLSWGAKQRTRTTSKKWNFRYTQAWQDQDERASKGQQTKHKDIKYGKQTRDHYKEQE